MTEAKAKVGNEAKGSLQDSSAADLIGQFNQERRTARLKFEHGGQQASVYLIDGSVVHAVLGDQMGDEVVFTVLGWEQGTFEVKTDVRTEVKTVTRSWPGLLLEGARLLEDASTVVEGKPAVQAVSTTRPSGSLTLPRLVSSGQPTPVTHPGDSYRQGCQRRPEAVAAGVAGTANPPRGWCAMAA